MTNSEPVQRVNPAEAERILAAHPDATLVDVRSRVEFEFVGHPIGAMHVAWTEFPDWTINPRFVTEVAAALAQRGRTNRDAPILCICRSGARSLAAAQALAQAGYTALYNVEEGFEGDRDAHGHRNTVNGWRTRGLPWEQT